MGVASKELCGQLQARAFIGRECVLGSTLVVPLRVIWRSYRYWCIRNDLTPRVSDLTSVLREAPYAKVVGPIGKGRFRVVVQGLGMRPTLGFRAPRAR